MNPDNSSLVNKLTLLVLSMILVCLVMLVVRAYQKPLFPEAPASVAEASVPVEVEPVVFEPTPVATNRFASRPIRTNVVRSVPPTRLASPQTPVVAESQGENSPTLVDNPALVVNAAVTEIAGGGVQSVGSGSSIGPGPELVGLVTLVGQPKPEVPIPLGASCGRINPGPVTTRHFVVGSGGGLANVFVYLKNARATPGPDYGPLLDQVGCMYEPYVMGVVTGQQFFIRNSDAELHNVHATPKFNPEFNYGQPRRGQVNRESFSKPEVFVRMKCDVHPWMFAYIGVVDHPYFAVTDTNGVFRLPVGFPAGTYTVGAMHLKAGELMQKISIHEGERRALQFQFTLPSSAEPHGRVADAH